MGIFDFLKKTPPPQEAYEPVQNSPEVLITRLLFFKKPEINISEILVGLKSIYKVVDTSGKDGTLLFFFPNIQVQFSNASIPAQLTILNARGSEITEINQRSLQQNWHWEEAAKIAEECEYEIHISDLMTRTLDYKSRIDLYLNFLAVLIKVTKPQAIHSLNSEKLINPEEYILGCSSTNMDTLDAIVNVRLFNIGNGQDGERLMDTIGMHSLGLPDFQIKFTDLEEGEVAGFLWNYIYYIYENGDVIESGNTIQGLPKSSKWKTEKQLSLVEPQRIVIDMEVN